MVKHFSPVVKLMEGKNLKRQQINGFLVISVALKASVDWFWNFSADAI